MTDESTPLSRPVNVKLMELALLSQAADVCAEVAKSLDDVAEGPIATDFGKAIHQAMAAGAKSCAAAILSGVPPTRDWRDPTRTQVWVVYCRPADFPEYWVARMQSADAIGVEPSHLIMLAPTLQELRTLLPIGLDRIPRHAEDDPNIVEVWL